MVAAPPRLVRVRRVVVERVEVHGHAAPVQVGRRRHGGSDHRQVREELRRTATQSGAVPKLRYKPVFLDAVARDINIPTSGR